ncbi:Outer membrane protein YopM [Yersinia pestis] [Rhizoctonia solani]|uniref:Outer membrane protein YopM [Yersinia pestis] n=1 Tax=Rhizoctonia solani TaxID=456999 RepID=A0A0K6FMB7_9AGAM|nr:Outer membrane protein YopM [Yersinia pestis] [Rhizoctonia solani]
MSPLSQPMQFGSLPLEVLQTILRLVPRDSLAPASLVCKTWRSITLPILYESLGFPRQVGSNERQTEFFRRIIDESENEDEKGCTFRLSSCVKRLRVESTMDEQELEFFSSGVVELKNLEHIGWAVSGLQEVEWYPTLVLLCQELPKLRSLSLTMAQNDIPLGDSDECVAFTNLRELSITFDGLTSFEDPDDELPHTIVQLIRGARNIESLYLKFEEDDEFGAAPWGSIDLFSELASDHFPNLRTLHICSQHLVPIDNYSGPEFRRFLQNHSQLEKIHLLTGGYDNRAKLLNPPPLMVTPTDMEEMMPSIRHFAGPGLLVGALLKSKLAKRIESLEFHEPAAVELGLLCDLIPELDSSNLPLSRLKGLVIFTSGVEEVSEWEIMLNALSKLPTRVPVLRELLLCPSEKPSPEALVCISFDSPSVFVDGAFCRMGYYIS